MSSIARVAAIVILFLSAVHVHADGMIHQLPKNGVWVAYEFSGAMKATGGTVNATKNFQGVMIIASVGQVTVKDQPCRWIEIQLACIDTNTKERMNEVYKILVPEKSLAKGQSPIKDVIQAWLRKGNEKAQPLTEPSDINKGPLPIILSGPWENAQSLPKATIEGKLGKLECVGEQGTLTFKAEKAGNIICRVENRTHEKSPFGIITCNWVLELPEMRGIKASIEWNLKFLDFGENAASKLPEVK